MKPFLLIQFRPEDKASDNEYQAFLKFGELEEDELERIRADKTGIPKDLDIEKYSGVIVGGGPYNVSDAWNKKSKEERYAERGIIDLLDKVIEKDIPYLGACYGLGILAKFFGEPVIKGDYGEDVGAVDIILNEDGKKDDLCKGLPVTFKGFVGHKESVYATDHAPWILLASSQKCPTHMVRVKNNIYATQFHPELDVDGLVTRMEIYKHHGYFKEEEFDDLVEMASKESVTIPPQILQRFIVKYKK